MNDKIDYDNIESIISLVKKGIEVPCPVCNKKIELYYAPSGELSGARCPDGHDDWPIVVGNFGIDYGD